MRYRLRVQVVVEVAHYFGECPSDETMAGMAQEGTGNVRAALQESYPGCYVVGPSDPQPLEVNTENGYLEIIS